MKPNKQIKEMSNGQLISKLQARERKLVKLYKILIEQAKNYRHHMRAELKKNPNSKMYKSFLNEIELEINYCGKIFEEIKED